MAAMSSSTMTALSKPPKTARSASSRSRSAAAAAMAAPCRQTRPETIRSRCRLGGFGGDGGNGGEVDVTISGSIVTHGERAHGVVAQSVGGGGGYGGDAKGKTFNALAIGGVGAQGGDGGDVTSSAPARSRLTAQDSIAIIAQSVGGGGGFGGAGFGRFGADDDGGGPNAIGFNTPWRQQGHRRQSHHHPVRRNRNGWRPRPWHRRAGRWWRRWCRRHRLRWPWVSRLPVRKAVSATLQLPRRHAMSQVWVKGASSYAMFGQSATGQGNSGAVDLMAEGSLFAQGADSVAAYAESTANGIEGQHHAST